MSVAVLRSSLELDFSRRALAAEAGIVSVRSVVFAVESRVAPLGGGVYFRFSDAISRSGLDEYPLASSTNVAFPSAISLSSFATFVASATEPPDRCDHAKDVRSRSSFW